MDSSLEYRDPALKQFSRHSNDSFRVELSQCGVSTLVLEYIPKVRKGYPTVANLPAVGSLTGTRMEGDPEPALCPASGLAHVAVCILVLHNSSDKGSTGGW